MYPKAVQDLCGWRIRSLACGYVTVSPVSGTSAPALGVVDTPRWCPVPRGLHSSIGCQVPRIPESGGEGLCSEQGRWEVLGQVAAFPAAAESH